VEITNEGKNSLFYVLFISLNYDQVQFTQKGGKGQNYAIYSTTLRYGNYILYKEERY